MSDATPDRPTPGTVGWTDLTIDDATKVSAFYSSVVGWKAEGLAMGDEGPDRYEDFVMSAADGTPICGVCHARGPNTGIPPVWLIYVHTEDLVSALERCTKEGGSVLHGPRRAGNGTMAVISDPAGAALALYQQD